MIAWLSELAQKHPLPVFGFLGVVALGFLFSAFRQSQGTTLRPTVEVVGIWRMDDPKGTCHHGSWTIEIQPQTITVRDPAGKSRTAPCTIEIPAHGPALVSFGQDLGWGKDIRLAAFLPQRDGSVKLSLSADDTAPGCKHPVTRD